MDHAPGSSSALDPRYVAAGKDTCKCPQSGLADVPTLPPLPRASFDDARPFTAKQGQYLAFIYYYTKIHGMPPAEADFRQVFRVPPPVGANAGVDGAVRTRIRALFDDPAARSGFVAGVIGKEVGLA